MICKVFRCDKCKKQFTRHNNLISHQKTECSELYKDIFAKNVEEFKHNENIMKKILTFNKSKKSFIYPYFAVYDFESLAIDVDKKKGDNTIILNKQVPISFSFGTNMTKDVSHVVSQNTKELIRSLIDFMYKSQEEANRRVMNEYYDYIKNYLLIKLKMKIIKDDRKVI